MRDTCECEVQEYYVEWSQYVASKASFIVAKLYIEPLLGLGAVQIESCLCVSS